LKLGYFLLKNPAPKDLEKKGHAADRERTELAFFQSSPWKDLGLNMKRVGICSLRSFLQTLLDRHIERELPKVREEIRNLIISTERDLDTLGEERPDVPQMRLFLSRMSTKFQRLAAAALSGEYHGTDPVFFPHSATPLHGRNNRLRAKIHEANMQFAHNMREYGQKRKVADPDKASAAQTNGKGKRSQPDDPLDMVGPTGTDGWDEEGGQLVLTKEEMILWVEKASRCYAPR